ncbi:hypothetical protein [Stutzerimonas xanthomarina]|uniref:Uncharacterized protein n=2 Tax=Stutzerimonas xanthomarina TaxID=271420 RepID=A0A1M5QTE4_9GAMM|nr:hypothetical protein [Stutzerimonas xanthomarina]MCP9338411.1 hypothetical protein [Stutzerimonas xanthomarina]SEH69457.1 hypothetical protein SAMN05216535_1303 [Stutzerimonas xanthomarina]SHH17050.1 hypothetical protein SAMN02744645_2817 [Stutzerimonas xanthomarina DSM 18231]
MFDFDVLMLARVAPLVNSLALLIALSGAWLVLATRWRRQLSNAAASHAGSHTCAIEQGAAAATRRLDRFFYGFGFSSLGLACLLSSLTRLS